MKYTIILVMSLVIICFAAIPAGADDVVNNLTASDDQSLVADDATDFTSLIVKYKESRNLSESAISNRLSIFGKVRHRRMSNLRRFSILKFNREKYAAKKLMVRIKADVDVEYVEPNYTMRAFSLPNDPHYKYQWNMQQLKVAEAWNITMGSAAVKVAVVDSGVAYNLDDLASTRFDLQNDHDFVENDDDAYDANGHGTHCTGTIAQSTNNNVGTVGIAPGVTILPVRVMGATGVGDLAKVAQGIVWAADHGADIVTLSLGGGQATNTMRDALKYAYNRGVTIFAATGNTGKGTVAYPAAYDEYVIAVGATRYDKQKASYSTYGSSLDIVAPGGDMTVDQNGDGKPDGILQETIAGRLMFRTDYTPTYQFFQGTSMACPHAAGVAALLKSYKPDATPSEIRDAIQNTAEDLGSPGWDSKYGHGLINPVAALKYIGAGSVTVPEVPVESGGECQQWSTTNNQHVFAGRAYTQGAGGGCNAGTTTYYAVGTDQDLGSVGTTMTTLYTTDGQSYYVGTCPDEPVDDTVNGTFNGTYTIVADHSGKALDTWEWGTSNGTNIAQYDNWGGEAQQFIVTPVDGIWHRISPAIASSQAVEVADAATYAGANIRTWTYSGNSSQQFRFQDAGNGMWQIIARHSEMCVSVVGASQDDGANVVQSDCQQGSGNQLFEMIRK